MAELPFSAEARILRAPSGIISEDGLNHSQVARRCIFRRVVGMLYSRIYGVILLAFLKSLLTYPIHYQEKCPHHMPSIFAIIDKLSTSSQNTLKVNMQKTSTVL